MEQLAPSITIFSHIESQELCNYGTYLLSLRYYWWALSLFSNYEILFSSLKRKKLGEHWLYSIPFIDKALNAGIVSRFFTCVPEEASEMRWSISWMRYDSRGDSVSFDFLPWKSDSGRLKPNLQNNRFDSFSVGRLFILDW